jgi:membrane-associated phospholipid phosphatase
VDLCIGAYLAATGLLVLVRDPDAGAFVPLIFRALYFAILVALHRHPLPRGRGWELIRRAYPLAFYPYFYAELAILNSLVTTQRFDPVVIGWEQAIFGTQPSVHLREWAPWWPLSEYLHLGYFSYYFVPAFTVAVLFARRQMRALSETVTAITLTFIACYGFFIVFPVVGPYHTFTPPDPESLGHVFPRITHALVRAGSSTGTAFPSSHVAVSIAAFIQAFRYDVRAGWVLVAFVPALVVGTVYGGFHYAVDALAGIVLAIVMNLSSRGIFTMLERGRTRSAARRNAPAAQRVAVARS